MAETRSMMDIAVWVAQEYINGKITYEFIADALIFRMILVSAYNVLVSQKLILSLQDDAIAREACWSKAEEYMPNSDPQTRLNYAASIWALNYLVEMLLENK